MKILVGIQKSKITTDNPKLLNALQRLYTFKVPGAAYTSAYKKRSWDGKQRFISANGTFRSGLLIKILKHLQKITRTYPVQQLELFRVKHGRMSLIVIGLCQLMLTISLLVLTLVCIT